MISAVLGRPEHEVAGKIFTDTTTGIRTVLIPISADFNHSVFRQEGSSLFDGTTFLPYLMDERDALMATTTVLEATMYDVSEVEAYKCAGKDNIKRRYGNSGSYSGFVMYRSRMTNQACVCVAVLDLPRNKTDGIAETIQNYAGHMKQQGFFSKIEEKRLGTSLAMAQNQVNLLSALLSQTVQTTEVQALLIARRRYMMTKMRELTLLMESSDE